MPSVIWFFWPLGTIFSKEKKHAPQFVPSFCRKNFSPKQWSIRVCGGKLQVIFHPWVANISGKEAFSNSESITTFTLLIEIYLPWKFQKVSPSRSRETSERGGPLKCVFRYKKLEIEKSEFFGSRKGSALKLCDAGATSLHIRWISFRIVEYHQQESSVSHKFHQLWKFDHIFQVVQVMKVMKQHVIQ